MCIVIIDYLRYIQNMIQNELRVNKCPKYAPLLKCVFLILQDTDPMEVQHTAASYTFVND